MRVPIQIINEQLQVTSVLNVKGHHAKLGIITFVVDTGSNVSTLGYGDMAKISLPESSLPFKEHTHIGGQTLKLHEITNAFLAFQDSEGQLQRFKIIPFYAAMPSKTSDAARNVAKQIPSIIGLDFLKTNKLALHCNPSKDEAYFEQ